MSNKHVGAIGGAIGSAVLAGALAVTINLGILRAAGPLRGPGRLGPVDVSTVVADASPPRPGGEEQASPAPSMAPTADPRGRNHEQETSADD